MPSENIDPVVSGIDDAASAARRRRDLTRDASQVVLLVAMGWYLLYAGYYIANSSFELFEKRWYCLFDDAMISMRYARNWVEGHGLVWNIGERVEGYSNPLWTAIMAGVHLLPLPDRLMSLAVQCLCVVIGLGYVWATYRLGRSAGLTRAVSTGGSAVTAIYYPLTHWNLQGMEQGLLCLLLVGGAAVAIRAWQKAKVSVLAGVLFALALATRADAFVPLAAMIVGGAVRYRRMRAPAFSAAIALIVFGAFGAIRWQYYGSFWPNTYYLKLGLPFGFRLGVLAPNFFSVTLDRLGIVFVGSCILVPAAMRVSFRWDLFTVFLSTVAYTIWVGGDAWPYDRFICPAIPFAGLALAHGYERFIVFLAGDEARPRTPRRPGLVPIAAVVLAFSMNEARVREWLRADVFYRSANVQNTCIAIAILDRTTEEARVATFWAGAIPYFSRRYAIDVLGKSDPHIAREVPPTLDVRIGPGHNKFDFEYSLLKRDADVLDMAGGTLWPDLTEYPWFQTAFRGDQAIVDGNRVPFWTHRRSPRVR
jgi:hypothetical protein